MDNPTGRPAIPTPVPTEAWLADDLRVEFEERAAILEYDAGLPRAEAERIAREEVYGPASGHGVRHQAV